MQKAQQSWWLVLGVAIAALIALPGAAQEAKPTSDELAACAAAQLPALQTEGESVTSIEAALGLEAPAAQPLTGPPGSCPKPTCDARVHCLYLSCPPGFIAVCNGGLGAGCEGTCGCRN